MLILGSSYSTPHKANISRRSKDSHGRILSNLDVWWTNPEVQPSHEKERVTGMSFRWGCLFHA